MSAGQRSTPAATQAHIAASGSPERLSSGAADVLGVVALAVLARLAYGSGAIGYDASYALVWGRSIGRGELPDFESPFAPTPHPLSNVVSAPLTWAGENAAIELTLLLSFVALGALGWFAFRLGSRLFHPAVGAVFALLLLTRPTLANETAQGLVDIPFLALVVAAGAIEVKRARTRWAWVLVLLGAAGLLRPEAWGLAAVYVLYAWSAIPRDRRVAAVGLALAAPVAWALFDLVVTGDPLYSLHGTQALAAELERPRGFVRAAESAPAYLREIVEPAVGWGGLAGVLLGLFAAYERSLLPAAVAGLGLAGFLVLGAANLPVLTRYLLVPAVVLALFCAVGVAGWADRSASEGLRTGWIIAAGLLAIGIAVTAPATVRELGQVRDFSEQRRAVQDDLRDVTSAAPAAQAVRGCGRLAAPEYQPVPLLALWLDRSPESIVVEPARIATDTAMVSYASFTTAQLLSLIPREVPGPPSLAPGTGTPYRNASWTLYARC